MYEDAGFPKNVYQSLLIDGSTASDLIKHKHVRGVTFTGSDEVGKEVAKEAASLSKKTVMELGSNDAFLVLEDADIDHAVEMCIQGRVINNGETCVAAKRFVIVDSVYENSETSRGAVKSWKLAISQTKTRIWPNGERRFAR